MVAFGVWRASAPPVSLMQGRSHSAWWRRRPRSGARPISHLGGCAPV